MTHTKRMLKKLYPICQSHMFYVIIKKLSIRNYPQITMENYRGVPVKLSDRENKNYGSTITGIWLRDIEQEEKTNDNRKIFSNI